MKLFLGLKFPTMGSPTTTLNGVRIHGHVNALEWNTKLLHPHIFNEMV